MRGSGSAGWGCCETDTVCRRSAYVFASAGESWTLRRLQVIFASETYEETASGNLERLVRDFAAHWPEITVAERHALLLAICPRIVIYPNTGVPRKARLETLLAAGLIDVPVPVGPNTPS